MKRNPHWIALALALALVATSIVLFVVTRDGDSDTTTIGPADPAVAAAEAVRREHDAHVRDVALTAEVITKTIDQDVVETWAFNGTVPGPEIRADAGDVIRARVVNDLPEPLTVHWHGIALRNDMDGVPAVTQESIPPGGEFVYEFTAPDPGTYFYHPHTGTQLDRGLYGALVVDGAPVAEYDGELTLLIDDWVDGTGRSPDDVLAELRRGATMSGTDDGDMGDMPGMDHGKPPTEPLKSAASPLGTDTGDVEYPLYLVNGQPATRPAEFPVVAGDRVLLRLINAGSDTPLRVAVGGSPLTVVATDGFAVVPVTVDALLIGMGERYDVIVTVPDVPAPAVVATAEGKSGEAIAVLRVRPAATGAFLRPDDSGRLLDPNDLVATPDVALPSADVDVDETVVLAGSMAPYQWGISPGLDDPITVRQGDRVRLSIRNDTAMWHPIHLHGHTFQIVGDSGVGARKDTVSVPAGGTVTVEFIADNPGQWVLHCHNIYHAETGMVTAVSYVR